MAEKNTAVFLEKHRTIFNFYCLSKNSRKEINFTVVFQKNSGFFFCRSHLHHCTGLLNNADFVFTVLSFYSRPSPSPAHLRPALQGAHLRRRALLGGPRRPRGAPDQVHRGQRGHQWRERHKDLIGVPVTTARKLILRMRI